MILIITKKLSDCSQALRRKDFNDIYTEFKKEQFGSESLSTMFSALEERIKSLKEKDEDYVLTFQKFDGTSNQPFILVVITLLIKRVHKLVIFNILKLFKIAFYFSNISFTPPPPPAPFQRFLV